MDSLCTVYNFSCSFPNHYFLDWTNYFLFIQYKSLSLPHSGPTSSFILDSNLVCLQLASQAMKWLDYWVTIHQESVWGVLQGSFEGAWGCLEGICIFIQVKNVKNIQAAPILLQNNIEHIRDPFCQASIFHFYSHNRLSLLSDREQSIKKN